MIRYAAAGMALALVLGACGTADEPSQPAVPEAGEVAPGVERPLVTVFKTPD